MGKPPLSPGGKPPLGPPSVFALALHRSFLLDSANPYVLCLPSGPFLGLLLAARLQLLLITRARVNNVLDNTQIQDWVLLVCIALLWHHLMLLLF